ncbi:hypothetical protein [Aromatoleum bremense]|uniref:Uncharacterized protein n=1 Tax=Aromatoleum bremense TaxID=76115 RepID=A0ABX1NVW0_9RHOO|nr:hypothetical protein [Aromatoleum bremense]NMG16159.1 hypothetical protein [Aromatoleum bremense]QTQ32596.1 Uncharacterized protein pbN1_26070 [Aromatoleum bremense]
MKSNLIIKDLSLDKALDRKAMSSVRGGVGNQANATQQGNFQEMFAPVAVANGADFGGSGPVNFQVTSKPTQDAWNDADNTNKIRYSHYYPYAA